MEILQYCRAFLQNAAACIVVTDIIFGEMFYQSLAKASIESKLFRIFTQGCEGSNNIAKSSLT